ncbi:ribonuclease domain-containing protein [Desertihabitans aurantiacus]|uniref:ribonuclease domain-containing protein n=1 Tax=Desertihabitans aurantiacus TaxID=2282477 RepID=UPI001E4562C5|nr:ribonuclease domain-containing protein [Desertihabitans aurantiacus]
MSSPRRRRTLAGAGGGVVALVLVLVALLWSDPGGEAVPPPATSPSATPSQAPSGDGPSGGVQRRDQEQVATDVDPQTGLAWVRLEQLPPEAAETVGLIEDGGPFPYRQDGAVFNNFEGLLPEEPRGHYREYTVPTPGEDDRGARRIVTGDDDTVFFWTADHYESFERIAR